MNLTCNQKGCLQISEAKLDVATNEVICEACGKPITNISESMKRTLKQNGQIIRPNLKKAFMVYCKKCNANREVMLDSNNNTICKDCKNQVMIQASFKLAMQELGYGMDKQPVVAGTKAKEAKEVDGAIVIDTVGAEDKDGE